MCGRYALFRIEQLRERFNIVNDLPDGIKQRYNVGPSQIEPVIISSAGQPNLRPMKWGFIPRWAKDTNSIFKYKTFNARCEGIFDKPIWKKAIRNDRCLIPADGFYEWKDTKTGKQPYFIYPKDNTPFAFAGVYGTWQGSTGYEWGTYSIITTESNNDMSPIHNRMPVILNQESESLWLDTSIDDPYLLQELMHPYPNGELSITEVSRDVNTIKTDEARLIAPLHAK